MKTQIFGHCSAVFQSPAGPVVTAVFNDVPVGSIPASLCQRQSGETVLLTGNVDGTAVRAMAYCGVSPDTFRRVVASFHEIAELH